MSIEIESLINKKSFYFFDKTIKSNSSVDFNKINLLFNEGFFVSNGFSDEALDIFNFDWNTPDRDRNWWWQIQALPFLNWFVNSFELHNDEQKIEYFQKCIEAIFCWVNFAKDNDESPLAWHDHAAAFRVRNIACWLVFCFYKKMPIENNEKIKIIFELIIDHLKWLRVEKNFSKHTNHGFDQAMISLTVCLMFDGDFFRETEIINNVRLKEELNFAFTDQGVHKENSPGYQKMMLNRLKDLKKFCFFGEYSIYNDAKKYIEGAEFFLSAITLPSSFLPMIGDTRGGDAGRNYVQKDILDFIDFSKSGYFIVRGKVLEKEFHLVFKCSHFSHYHRHDDDLSIHIFYDGKTVLGDGGLGSHNEKDISRKILRSWQAHNVPFIFGVQPFRKVAEDINFFPQMSLDGKCITATSCCYGSKIKRVLDLSNIESGVIRIEDSMSNNESLKFGVNYFSPESVQINSNSISISSLDTELVEINFLTDVVVSEENGFISYEFSKFIRNSNYSIFPKSDDIRVIKTEILLK